MYQPHHHPVARHGSQRPLFHHPSDRTLFLRKQTQTETPASISDADHHGLFPRRDADASHPQPNRLYISALFPPTTPLLTPSLTDNLRILRPNVKTPIITSSFEKSPHTNKGTWTAAVWSNDNKVIFTTVEGEGNVVDAMRRLLLLTSVSMKEMMNEW